jgi:GPR1/FUN34/yaaH family
MTALVTAQATQLPAPAADSQAPSGMADPMPMAYGLFGFALAVFGVRFATVDATSLAAGSTTVALNYAVLVAGIAETLAGVLGVIRGMGYPAYVTSTFGIWLLGFYLLATSGAHDKTFTANALAWYVLILVVPVAIMAVPAFVHRNYAFSIAFLTILATLVLAGLGFHSLYNAITSATAHKTPPDVSNAVDLVKASGWTAWAAAIALWYVFAREVYKLTGVIKG